MSPAGKPKQCTHVRQSMTLSSPSRSAQYSTLVSVIAYTSRSLRTSTPRLDLGGNLEHPIWSWVEERELDEERENGEELSWGNRTSSLVSGREALLSFNRSKKIRIYFFFGQTLLYWIQNIFLFVFPRKQIVALLIRSYYAVQFIGPYLCGLIILLHTISCVIHVKWPWCE